MPYVQLVVVLVVIVVLASVASYVSFKRTNAEADRNRPIAEKYGLHVVPVAAYEPESVFKQRPKPDMRVGQLAVDTSTGDVSYQIYWRERPIVYVRGVNDWNHFNFSKALATTGFWVEQSVVIEKRKRSKRKLRDESGNDTMASRYKVISVDGAAAQAVATTAMMEAIDTPPFETEVMIVHFLGPQVMVWTDAVEFEKRAQLLRWAQQLGAYAAPNVPGRGSYSVKVTPRSEREVPQVEFVPMANHALPTATDDFDPSDYLNDPDAADA